MNIAAFAGAHLLVLSIVFLTTGISRWEGIFELMAGGWVMLPDHGILTKAILVAGIMMPVVGLLLLYANGWRFTEPKTVFEYTGMAIIVLLTMVTGVHIMMNY